MKLEKRKWLEEANGRFPPVNSGGLIEARRW